MELEVEEFGLTGVVGQAPGTEIAWEISWPGVFVFNRFVAVSFLPMHGDTKLERISEWFRTGENENNPVVGELIRATGEPSFRFAVVVFGFN
jgi:hypothetical protein